MAGALTVKATGPLVPFAVVTVTLCPPVAAAELMTNVAVIEDELKTAGTVTVMPIPATAIVAPEMKPVPVSVTGTLAPFSS